MRDYKLTLNLVTNDKPDSKKFKQYDTGNEIELELYKNEHLKEDEKLVLSNETVLAFFQRSDNVVLQKNCIVRNGNIIAKTSKDVLGVPGVLLLECLIKDGENETTTTTISFTVDKSIERDKAITADPRYNADLVTDLINLKENVKQETQGKIDKVAQDIVDINSHLEDNAMQTISTDASLTKLNSGLDGNLIIDKIQGRTLVNLVKANSSYNITSGYLQLAQEDKLIYSITGKRITIKNLSNKKIVFQTSDLSGGFYSQSILEPNSSLLVTIPNDGKFRMMQGLYTHGWENTSQSLEEFKKAFIILEGDYTQNTPDYFEGMKSVGEDNQNKIEISTCEKNLINANQNNLVMNGNVEFVNGQILSKDTSEGKSALCYFDSPIYLAKNQDYVLTMPIGTYTFSVVLAPSNLDLLNPSNHYNVTDSRIIQGVTSGTPFKPVWSGYYKFGIYLAYNTSSIKIVPNLNIQVEQNIISTLYEPYKSDKSEISLSSPLREWDYIDKNGVHRKTLKQVIDNSYTDIYFQSTNSYNITNFYFRVKTGIDLNANNIICDKLKLQNSSIANETGEGFTVAYNAVYIRIKCETIGCLPSDNTTVKIQKFKVWLQTNPITFLYEDNAETIEPLNSSLVLQSFKDGYFGLNCGAINPVVSLRFPTNMGERLKATEEALTATKKDYYSTLKTLIQTADKVLQLELNKQDKMDSTLTTVDKTIVGAIKENKSAIDNSKIDITNLQKDATVIPFPFDTNFSNHSAYSQYIKKNGLVCIIIDVQKKDNTSLGTDWVKIGKVPREIIPTNTIDGYAMTYPAQEPTALRVLDTGDVFILVKSQEQKYAYGSINFYAKGGTI